jgi:hypothetical protein
MIKGSLIDLMSLKNDDFSTIAQLCRKSDFGKRLPNGLYIDISVQLKLSAIALKIQN